MSQAIQFDPIRLPDAPNALWPEADSWPGYVNPIRGQLFSRIHEQDER